MPDLNPNREIAPLFGSNAYQPDEIAAQVENVGVKKARLPCLKLAMLGVLAGVFIGLGSLYFVIVQADPSYSVATGKVLGGVLFSLGLLLVVVAGAELFTGNNLIAMAWAEGKIGSSELLYNWALSCTANLVGGIILASLVYASGHASGPIGHTYLKIAIGKVELPLVEAFFRGVLCNVLVCLAVWMSYAGRTVIDKFVAILLPISAFVAAGFEHSVANMYFFPIAFFVAAGGATVEGIEALTFGAASANLAVVIAGNVVGGSVLVALVYSVIYRRGRASH